MGFRVDLGLRAFIVFGAFNPSFPDRRCPEPTRFTIRLPPSANLKTLSSTPDVNPKP